MSGPKSLFRAAADPLLARAEAEAIARKALSFATADETRVIINSVKTKTPTNAAAPVLAVDVARRPSISAFIRRPARHMCTVSDATSTAATTARTPSHSA